MYKDARLTIKHSRKDLLDIAITQSYSPTTMNGISDQVVNMNSIPLLLFAKPKEPRKIAKAAERINLSKSKFQYKLTESIGYGFSAKH